ncbi:DNA topoisomerase [Leuconostocaceae bacterium ESL0958]|nr:DNA topoisomerase [Leuconostocaceae bacterium ESL0958]
MTKYLILTEKPSARRNFEKALGASKGTFAGFKYELANLRGHVMTLKEPEQQVNAALKEKYASWQLTDLPWSLDDLNWERTYITSKNPKTGKKESTKALLDALKKQSSTGFDAIVIATDHDPSGEGELLAWEALEAIGWQGTVLRAYFVDESEKGIKRAMHNLKVIKSKAEDADYQKGLARNKWDFASMQLTRAATTASRQQGFQFVSRQGRLKSAMIVRIYQQLQAIENYQRIPYFENRFKDNQGNIYARAVSKDMDPIPFRYPSQQEAVTHFHDQATTGTPVVVEQAEKATKPPKLLDLSSLSARLAKLGYNAQEVLATYQKMYESQVVSYPRTEDKTITFEQFYDLLPLVDSIAAVVHIDADLLTHRDNRPTHVKKGGAHGANRPGPNVPESLESLTQYGPSAPKIYELLAKNFLAMFAEDYRYHQTKAQIQEAPAFQTTINEPIAAGWKVIYQDEQDHSETTQQPMGTQAQLFVYEGQNAKPTAPTWSWLKAFLEKYDIGTGATRTSTYAELSNGKYAYIIDKKGKITLSAYGQAAAQIVENTYIANPKTTKRVFEIFDQVGRFEMTADEALQSIQITVEHDLPMIVENAKQLAEKTQLPAQNNYSPKEKVSGTWQGKEVSFNNSFAGHTFTSEEQAQLLAGETIIFEANKKKGGTFTAQGKLAEKTYKGKRFVGFDLVKG